MRQSIRIGTRGSPLALAQASEVRARLIAAWPDLAAPEAVEIVVIRTTGDRIQDRALSEIGGKGLFTKEIEEALADGGIDLAVHSMKDVPTWLPDGMEISTLLPREDPRDAFFAREAISLATLPPGAVVGTASLRRQSLVLAARPDLSVVTFRGNVATRLRKLEAGEVDATLLAVAGLNRLGQADRIPAVLSVAEMLPAVGQGAIGIEIRSADDRTRALLAPLHCPETALCVAAERALLAVLDGSCRTPIAAYARRAQDGRLRFDGLIARPDGSAVHRIDRLAEIADSAAAATLGRAAGEELKSLSGPGFLAV